ncbi:MAG: hypothetical protein A2508_02060 [Candidatus Lambdaproteobacteria bacterium RIFOXYD12_FULL_49_8]|uniref:SAM-dependent MTase RsmB/NOP-type domain-containing protein n=1 Tax=Candidatus Lambdaproteobacteria bacterium RIFOXYD2_FULL_50_16 TaxID=1817772 RepID=A0A1F6G6C9_9PROT|nr:MAG: hypothetical protein A2527_11065 [Candidatus Lambdaproteobacteria bacterium RIFOXYD2_FULL_50_16]OGG98030.1 MAG: hypothetical protein A2508_02060 [Candidatus Lambdaproteobacteria bacterium RIFOXYD12_FULL_49_8]
MKNNKSKPAKTKSGGPAKTSLDPRFLAAQDLIVFLKTAQVHFRDDLPPKNQGLYRLLLAQAVRHKDRLLHLSCQLTGRELSTLDLEVQATLMLGLVQLDPETGIDEWAAINETVQLMLRFDKPFLKGVINASLRRYQREQKALEAQVPGLALQTSHPLWMLERWQKRYGQKAAEQIALANNQWPLMWLLPRPDLGCEGLLAVLKKEGIEATLEEGVVVREPKGLFDTQAYKKGLFLVQDQAAQGIVPLMDGLKKDRFLDACAAPGGKLVQALWRFGDEIKEVWAAEPKAGRMQRLEENLGRLGLKVNLEKKEAQRLEGAWDLILADVPCSATGTIGKHPEIKWNRSAAGFLQNQQGQLEILNALAKGLKPGGHLLYSTCSLEPEENEGTAQAFLAGQAGFVQVALPGASAPYHMTLPQKGSSGAFAALFRRQA